MARGKHGNRSANRRTAEEQAAEVANYQRHVKRLVDENRDLRDRLDKERVTHLHDVKVLRAQLAEGLTPELLAMRRQIETVGDRASAAEARNRQAREDVVRFAKNVARYLHEVAGERKDEARMIVLALADHIPGGVLHVKEKPAELTALEERRAGGPDGYFFVQLARGDIPPGEAKHFSAAMGIAKDDDQWSSREDPPQP